MRYPQPLIEATWIQRYKRFLLDVRVISTGKVVQVHCANTGSMLGINQAESRCLILPADNPKRRLHYTLEAVRSGKIWVGAHPMRANTLAREALIAGMIPEVSEITNVRTEVAYGNASRADLSIATAQGTLWIVEVKSASFARGQTSLFPDAVTQRGQKHLDELRQAVHQGARALMLFVATRSDVTHFSPEKDIDAVYAQKLVKASQAGVLVAAIKAHVTLTQMIAKERIPVVL